jgi:hypothetical protein
LKAAGVLAQSAVAASFTGTLTETVLATIAIPAGAIGVNGGAGNAKSVIISALPVPARITGAKSLW